MYTAKLRNTNELGTLPYHNGRRRRFGPLPFLRSRRQVSESRVLSSADFASKLLHLRSQIEDNRRILELVSRQDYTSDEILWTRSALTNRANFLRESIDRLLAMQAITEADKRARQGDILRANIGTLFIDGRPLNRND